MSGGGFSLGAEDKISMSLDDLIEHRKKASKSNTKPKKPSQNARMKALSKSSSTKRQAQMNKRRGIGNELTKEVVKKASKQAMNEAMRKEKKVISKISRSSSARVMKNKQRRQAAAGKKSSSNSQPTKFKLPKGANMKITVNVQRVRPVIGGNKMASNRSTKKEKTSLGNGKSQIGNTRQSRPKSNRTSTRGQTNSGKERKIRLL